MSAVKASKCLQPSYTIEHNKFKVDQVQVQHQWWLVTETTKVQPHHKIETLLEVEKYGKQLSYEISK